MNERSERRIPLAGSNEPLRIPYRELIALMTWLDESERQEMIERFVTKRDDDELENERG